MNDRKPVVLLTGFEPYGGRSQNPSAAVAEAFDGESNAGHVIRGAVLPVRLDGLAARLGALIEETAPAVVVSLGLYPGESAIRLERYGVNLADFDIPDNNGEVAREKLLDPGQPVALAATLPLAAIRRALLRQGIPAHISNTAGTYLCNAALFSALSLTAARQVPTGFVHLPYLPEQVAGLLPELDPPPPSMALATMTQAIGLVIETTLAGADAVET